jgi:NSS family neurotransmitter:Na+ symporter
MAERENLKSRLGFLLLSAGSAIGLGNVWRFPFITGRYGGATFVLIYLIFIIIFGIPIMTLEFAVGRGAQLSTAKAFHKLEPNGTRWHIFSYFSMAGNYILMMFYTVVSGWIFSYLLRMLSGQFNALASYDVNTAFAQVGSIFNNMLASPAQCVGWLALIVAAGFALCMGGLQKSVEKVSKVMMIALFVFMIVIAIRAMTLPGAGEGLRFYLQPKAETLFGNGFSGFIEVVFAAMGQAFFTLSIGIGSMAVFGSYLKKERRLLGESITVGILDTFVALCSGLIVFSTIYANSPDPANTALAGPPLIFISLPSLFIHMPGGQIWGTLFFVFMLFAALSTVIATFENIIAFAMDLTGCGRVKACLINAVIVFVLALPCALGFNVWAGFVPFAPGTGVLDLEDFILSQNLLPLGSLVFALFCSWKFGWGWDNFIAECNAGTKGPRFPKVLKRYYQFVLPILILFVFVMGYVNFNFG